MYPAPRPGPSEPSPLAGPDNGFTLVELAVVLGLAAILLSAVGGALLSQRRFYTRNADVASSRAAARTAVQLLTAELRGLAPAKGDLYGFAVDSVALRSLTGFGFICAVSGTSLSLRRLQGTFADLETDSVLVFVEHDPEANSDDQVITARVVAARSGSADLCPDSLVADRVISLDRAVDGSGPGAPVRAFRPYVYRLYQASSGIWWLGQRLRGGVIQPLTGPFSPPGLGGLHLAFLDEAGGPAAHSDEVVLAVVSVRTRGRLAGRLGARDFSDSLSSAVHPRNR